ncbi:tetratricopeptide repeat protein [Dyella lipolytica]|uniref:Tetratricopeptide repeat protein n=1 Tax=Dyella lipolytica TaxID=1867835 RepID=A0ABW8IQT1_9GAMM|nr:hypothetical protein [Dyella lipolytica]
MPASAPKSEITGYGMRNRLTCGVAVIVLIVIGVVYWPVIHAGFVWDDVLDFVQMGWLRHGDEWKHYIFKDFNNWPNYFRPLVVGLFTLEVRLFDSSPGAMHGVSLAIHLIDTLLVGLLSWQCSSALGDDLKRRTCLLAISMLLYGLHPVLIEPVTWIGCQFDLAATMLMLLGLLANTVIQNHLTRATVVAILFFLAACCKESAVSFPLMIAVFDWALIPRHSEDGRHPIRTFIRRNWQTYTAMFFAGIIYLAFRHWALGQVLNTTGGSSASAFARLQEVCFIYLHYWQTLFWPMHGMNPIHEIDAQRFQTTSASSILIDATAICIVAAGLYSALKHASPMGCIVMMMTVALIPVLHISSIAFAASLYHERYVMTSLAGICAMLPLIRAPIYIRQRQLKFIPSSAVIAGCLWFVLAVVDIRMTLPLWSNNVSFWQWALAGNPDSLDAKDSLLSAYIDTKDYAHAQPLADQLLTEHASCANCMLNIAILAVAKNDPARAAIALEEVRNSKEVAADEQMYRMYLLTTGQMLLLQGHPQDADQIFRAAIELDPLDPQPQLSLATALAMQGKESEARSRAESGIALLSPDMRDSARRALNKAIDLDIKLSQQVNHSEN